MTKEKFLNSTNNQSLIDRALSGPLEGIRWDNLQRLADGIEASTLFDFDMSCFRAGPSFNEGDLEPIVIRKDGLLCGTVACALGYGPAISGLEPAEACFGDYTGILDFPTYCEQTFGFSARCDDSLWMWLFDDEWKRRDNTRAGAVARIRWAVEHRGAPDDWLEQVYGHKPLCYAVKS